MRPREIEVANNVDWLSFDEKDISLLYKVLDEFGTYAVERGILSIAFLSESNMCDIHKKFLNDSSSTDVMAFPGNGEFGYAGEICVSPEYARRACNEFQTTLRYELTLYLVHGYLHLSGLDDGGESDRLKMHAAEKTCMELAQSHFAIPNFVNIDAFTNL
jgi:probable rRNA maturation factor